MLYSARLIECTKLEEMKSLVILGAKIMTSRLMSNKVQQAINELEESIRRFPQLECLNSFDPDWLEETGNDEDEGNRTPKCMARHTGPVIVTCRE